MSRKALPSRAFTLVELLVVIAVIAILIAMLLPGIRRVREAANTVTCASNMRQLGQAFSSYTVMYDGVLAYSLQDKVTTGTTTYWFQFFAYVPSLRPMVNGTLRSPPLTSPTQVGGTRVKCPKNKVVYGSGAYNGVSYPMMNSSLGTNGFFRNSISATHWFNGRRLAGIKSPGRFIMSTDGATREQGYGERQNLDYGDPMCANYISSSGIVNRGGASDRIWMAHPNDTANVMYGDGHVETTPLASLKAMGVTNYWDNKGLVYP